MICGGSHVWQWVSLCGLEEVEIGCAVIMVKVVVPGIAKDYDLVGLGLRSTTTGEL